MSYEQCIICAGHLGSCNCVLGDIEWQVYLTVHHATDSVYDLEVA